MSDIEKMHKAVNQATDESIANGLRGSQPDHLEVVAADNIDRFIRAFWKRIYPFRNKYERVLPAEMPIEFRVHCETAVLWLRKDYEELEAQHRWRRVEDGLPKSGVQVLGALRGESGRYSISRINYTNSATDHDWEADGWEIGNCWTVTHWMPLPAPPEGE